MSREDDMELALSDSQAMIDQQPAIALTIHYTAISDHSEILCLITS
ncbi:hypothetical protein I8751_27975 [Nostocaceae cyanobacterium CENA357]|uniref:Uncharacterized protein n=1 Tax=Atlanticothrix silvestris CENA357 TaxID=1725252 RepID=A0A8J7HJR3_9CYAN|nr:hypothetical protein [Atlanticothrix silvestris]MBH8556108.1 hypothetical protein [Atlanticothrix silvestris CENA357]